MSKTVISFIVAAGLLVAAVALNPSAEKHRTRIKEAIAERSQINKILWVGQLTAFVSTYHSVWVGSYTTLNEKVISVGAFGMVVVAE